MHFATIPYPHVCSLYAGPYRRRNPYLSAVIALRLECSSKIRPRSLSLGKWPYDGSPFSEAFRSASPSVEGPPVVVCIRTRPPAHLVNGPDAGPFPHDPTF
eukprot:gene15149-21212_t